MYLNDEPHESGTESLTLEDLPNDWENLRLFENLRSLTVNHCTQPDAMETLRAELPNCELRYSLCVGGQWFDSDARGAHRCRHRADGHGGSLAARAFSGPFAP